jgi:hypothetical protein
VVLELAVLLRLLRHSLEGGEEQVQGGQEGPHPSPQVILLLPLVVPWAKLVSFLGLFRLFFTKFLEQYTFVEL